MKQEKRSSVSRSGRRRSVWSQDGEGDDDDDEEDALVTVFKKSSRNEKVTVFMGNREVVDNGMKVNTVELH